MPKVSVYNVSGKQVGEIQLADSVFGIEPHTSVLHDAVVMQLASLRSGTHKTKTRTEVSGGGRKPWKQKGTGRARQGSIRAPQWKGGGIVFGPTPRSYAYKLNKKVRRLALKSALSAKVQDQEVIILDQLEMQQPKTKEFAQYLSNLNVTRKALIVSADINEAVQLSSRNIPGVKYVAADGINVLDLLNHDRVIFTQAAVAKVEEVFA